MDHAFVHLLGCDFAQPSNPLRDEIACQLREPRLYALDLIYSFVGRFRPSTLSSLLRILQVADACSQPGEIGALLRREGLYTSHLSDWRRQREEGALVALARPRGRRRAHPLETENAELRRCLERAEADLSKARKVIEVRGNVSALLGELLAPGSAETDPKPGR